MQLTMSVQGMSQLKGNLKKLIDDNPDIAAKALYTSAMNVLIPAIRKRIRQQKNVFTGEWANRQAARTDTTTNTATLEVGAFGVPYGLNIEQGAKPHSPDEQRIKEWVKKKLKVRGKARQDMVAKRIAAMIAAHGTKAYPTLEPVWRANSSHFYADFVARMRAGLLAKIKAP